jgi:hypothetical protein
MTPYREIESTARLADPDNRTTIHNLAHEVMVCHHVYSVPDPVAGLLEDRLTDAEIRFRNKTGPGVSEEQLVDLLNWMGDKLHLPSYTKTTAAQVTTLRMKLAVLSPTLMGSTLAGKELRRGDHVRPEMSPLQAMHLVLVMADQKIMNENYQDPTIDIPAAERELAKKAAGASTLLTAHVNPKSREVRNVLSSSISSMSIQDALDVIDHALKALQLD